MLQKEISSEELKQLSQGTHYFLREQLLQLRRVDLDSSQRQLVDNQVATNMRSLFDYHKSLYERESDKPLNLGNFYQVQQFIEWRLDRVGAFGSDTYASNPDNDSYALFSTDRKRFLALFRPLYSEDDYTNHWHVKIIGDQELDLGDIHTDLTYGRIISSYIPKNETQFYHGGVIPEGAEPTLTVSETGVVDMNKLTYHSKTS